MYPDSAQTLTVFQPTGGVILLTDTTPSEPKTLMELKARKSIKAAAAPETLQDRVVTAFNSPHTPEQTTRGGEGAVEAVGVLTAVDEDEEGAEDAEVPNEFEYYSDEHPDDE